MNKGTIATLIVCALFAGGCETLNSIVQLQKPTASLNGVTFGEVSLESAEVLFDVEVSNPYGVELPLLNVDYDLKSGGSKLLNGTANIATNIPAGSTQTVTLPVDFKYTDLINAMAAMKDVRPGSRIPYDATVGIGVDTPMMGRIRLPINHSGSLRVPTIEEAAEMDWVDILNKGRKILNR